MPKEKKRAVFLDRDGIINLKPPEHDYVKRWKDFKFLPDVAKAIRYLNKNFLVIVVTNQRGIGRGIMTVRDLNYIHNKMKAELRKQGAKIDAIYFCPHDIKDNCHCRKPKPGMILKAAKDFNIDLSRSYFIGDDITDIRAGRSAGCKTFLVDRLFSKNLPKINVDYVVPNLMSAVKILQKIIKN